MNATVAKVITAWNNYILHIMYYQEGLTPSTTLYLYAVFQKNSIW